MTRHTERPNVPVASVVAFLLSRSSVEEGFSHTIAFPFPFDMLQCLGFLLFFL